MQYLGQNAEIPVVIAGGAGVDGHASLSEVAEKGEAESG